MNTLQRIWGPLLVALAATLWATDSLFRYGVTHHIDPVVIVTLEHGIGTLLLLPWVWLKYRGEIFSLSAREWLAAAVVGIGGSAFATFLFTASFKYVNPSVSILLQKLQPVVVILISYLFLGERPQKRFFLWAAVAFISGLCLSFPELVSALLPGGPKFELNQFAQIRSQGAGYAFSAMLLWALSTIAGKVLLSNTAVPVATFWRYILALLSLLGFLALTGTSIPWSDVGSTEVALPLLYMSGVAGVLAMLFYYAGLKRTPAIVTTFIELIYPVAGVLLNTYVLHQALSSVQLGAGAVLVVAVTMLSAS